MSSSVSTLSPAILSSQPIEVSNHEFLESIFCKASELSVDFFEINVEKFSNFRWFFSKPLAS
jgi:hypothetical protein